MNSGKFCVCVPARNEAMRLPVLLEALAAQTISGRIPVALCINNSDDGSAAAVAETSARYASRLDVRIDECVLATGVAHVGTARRRAMHAGFAVIDGHGVLVSTDADCRPPSEWLAANLAAIDNGADIVGGQIVPDAAEAMTAAMAAMRMRFDQYWAAVRDIEDAVDPSRDDPRPRHGDHTGASLAIDAQLYQTAGGVPALACGEDRALVIAAVAAGGRLAHPISVWTRVSSRTEGRATGGMAAAMARLTAFVGDNAEPRVAAFDHWHRRAAWRNVQRSRHGVAAMLALEATLPPMPADMMLPALAR